MMLMRSTELTGYAPSDPLPHWLRATGWSVVRGSLIVLTLLTGAPTLLPAQELPTEANIGAALQISLPVWWTIEQVSIKASVNDGDAVEPRVRQRFVAGVAPAEALFALAPDDAAAGPFNILVQTKPAAETHSLYGIAHSELQVGEWVTGVVLENSVDDLGRPRSYFSGPTVIVGSEEAERVAASLLGAQELANAVQQGLARATADEDLLNQLAAETAAALKIANQQRLDELRAQYEAERVSIAAAGERERAALEEENRQRLEALKASLANQSVEVEAIAAQAEAERERLIAENRKLLEALIQQHERERAAVTAAAETLLAVTKAEAETAAQQELAPALQALAEEQKRAAKLAAEVEISYRANRIAVYDRLVHGFGADSIAERFATLDVAMASGDEGQIEMALSFAFDSADETLKTRALELALSSENEGLKAKTVQMLLSSGDEALVAKTFESVLASGDEALVAKTFESVLASGDEARAVELALASDDTQLAMRLPRTTQWADRVVDFSKQSSKDNQTAKAALGSPSVGTGEECRGDLDSWYAGGSPMEHYIRVGFAKPVLFPDVVVHETGSRKSSHGFVRRVILWDANGDGTEYQIEDRLNRCPGASTFNMRRHKKAVVEVSVVIDTSHAVDTGSEGIDAIALIGYTQE